MLKKLILSLVVGSLMMSTIPAKADPIARLGDGIFGSIAAFIAYGTGKNCYEICKDLSRDPSATNLVWNLRGFPPIVPIAFNGIISLASTAGVVVCISAMLGKNIFDIN